MRLSRYLLPTTREDPSDAEIVSHRLMIRSGMIRKVAAGIYDYLPLGLRVLRKVENIIREEMNRAGAIELLMPMVLPAELWRESGRWDLYGKELLRFKDRGERDFCLGPTHEEVITDLVKKEVRSYRQLPINLYQIQTKFRDEMRPRFGLMRGREFIMKDAYSFDADEAGADRSYQAMYDAYTRIFSRMGLTFRAVEADTGAIGGSSSHEFMVLADSGEDEIVSCFKCDYSANRELAQVSDNERADSDADIPPIEEVNTPGKRTIEEVSSYLGIPPDRMIKCLLFETGEGSFAVVAGGNRTINEVKVKNFLGADWIELAGEDTVKLITGSSTGFAGPVGLSCKMLADRSVLQIRDGVTGANRDNYHYKHVRVGRDYDAETYGDFRVIDRGDPCPRCGGELMFSRGIEVGHVFKLGTKYSTALNAVYLGKDGKEKEMVMGCYGIGVGRTVAASIEQSHDDDGIVFPISIAPFEVAILPLNLKNEELNKAADFLYADLIRLGVEVIIDDRDERPGIKFKDADLIGVPLRVTVGEKKVAEGLVEIRNRMTGDTMDLDLRDAADEIKKLAEQGRGSPRFSKWRRCDEICETRRGRTPVVQGGNAALHPGRPPHNRGVEEAEQEGVTRPEVS
jgi:prolyl-tRNA synthetase